MVQVVDEIDTSPVRIVAKFAGRGANPSNKQVVTWFDAETYSRFEWLLKGTFDYPPSYDQWRRLSEATERYWISRGAQVIRVTVDPDGFQAWCSKRFLKPNGKALDACINEKLFQNQPCLSEDCP